ncbi:hypothetical protein KUTeg_025075 [Tegillarca granosa]|uniref:Protein FAM114A2 n=1 Tax=Tegillarca granosa TaxID=220873 RepID=A0ABQ9E317_TEGGR|nr:hypothetical protein KUTeg_025075 [Tegillarca granosa]
MSDSEDEAAFASADEGDGDTQAQTKSKNTEDKQKEQPKPASKTEEKDKSQKQGNSKNVKTEHPHFAKGKGKSQEQVKTQQQSKQHGGKKGKGGKGKKQEKKEKSEEMTNDEHVSETVATKSPVDTEESVHTETEKQSKTEDKITQEKTGTTESTESRLSETLSENLPTESSKKEETKTDENSESKELSKPADNKSAVSQSEKDSSESKSTDTKDVKKDPKSALDQLASDNESGDGWSWGNWGSSLIDVASSSVSTFTHQVGEGFNTIMDTVETSLGAPSPEELLLLQGIKEKDEEVIKTAPEDTSIDRAEDIIKKQEEENTEEKSEESEKESEKSSSASGTSSGGGGGWFSGWGMSSLTSVVQNTTNIVQNKSKDLVSGGLDVLETIGKKTMDVIKDHDPGLKVTKGLFLTDKGDKQSLSSLLREAKEEAAKKVEQEKEFEETRKAHFGCMFDEYQGLAHLEALEILSNQCEKKVQSLLSSMPPEALAGIKQELIQIKQVFEMEEEEEEEEEVEHEFSKLVTDYLSEFHLGTTPDKINKVVHQTAIQSLAELTSKSVEQFHKAGELVLLQKDSNKKFLDRSKSLSSFTKVLCTEVGILSTKFSHCLNKLAEDMEDNSSVNPLVTNVYLEPKAEC